LLTQKHQEVHHNYIYLKAAWLPPLQEALVRDAFFCRWKSHASALAGSPGQSPPRSPALSSQSSSHHDPGGFLEAEPSFAAGFAPHPKQHDPEQSAVSKLKGTGLTVAVPTSPVASSCGWGLFSGHADRAEERIEEWLQDGGSAYVDGCSTPSASAERHGEDEVLYDDDLLSYVSDTDYAEIAALAAEVNV
jgi:hypothetical protein